MLACVVAKGQLVADFNTDTRQGCAPLVVYSFTNLSSANAKTYFWDFGNNITSTQQNPGTIYFNPGTYTVKLIVADAAGKKDSVIKTNYIVVNSPPVVNFTASNTSGCVPFGVQFTDKSNPVSGNLTKWEWDFGDGTTSLQQSPAHTFNVSGDFTITLKATNSLGCVSVHTATSYIHVNQIPKADFTSGSAATCNPPALVNFINTSTGSSITNIKWIFGDGFFSNQPNPSHTFTTAGTYQVSLIVTNQNGCVDTITKPTVIGAVHPGFTSPDTICQGALSSFINTSSPATASAFWNFGDNTTSSAISPVKAFSAPGSFVVKLVNNFGACQDSVTRRIAVIPKPVADFSFTAPPAGCMLPVTASFTSNTTGATFLKWDFGDNSTSTAINPSHTYTAYNTYSVKLTATAANGCIDSVIKQDIISVLPVKIQSFVKLPFYGCAPHTQGFAANITSPEPVTTYFWNFGDGSTSTNSNPQHTYNAAGSYNVSLKVTTANGCTDSFTLPNAIVIATQPTANFTANPQVACAYQKIQFTDASTGTIDKRKWEFGDGGVSADVNPLYHYADTGFFTVRLIVSNLSCVDTLTLKNYIYINPPVAHFFVQYDCAAPLTRRFINQSVVAKTSQWDFGDGSAVSTDSIPVHSYASPGIYFVHLHVTNGECYDDLTDTINVIDEHPDFTVSQPNICRNNPTVFNATNINPQNIKTYTWNFGDSTTSITTIAPSVIHNYLKAGAYKPSLTITDIDGCTKTVDHPTGITIYGPIVNFGSPEGACINAPVTFTDLSASTASRPLTNWIFNFGDGISDTTNAPTFVHTYHVARTYNLSLVVTDSLGCKDTLFKQNAINITSPKAAFSLQDSISCSNSPVNFINQSAGLDLSYEWNFGDGIDSKETSPTHAFTKEGKYDLSLSVIDRYGCTDTIKKPKGITIANPKALFSLSDSVIFCPPAQISFVDSSLYATSIKWDFDDGNFSDIAKPIHYFLSAKTYHIKLTAYGHGSCADSTIKNVMVQGPSGTLAYNTLFKCVPASIDFTAKATNNNNNYTWDFGDGTATTTSSTTISHVYTLTGKFLPKVLLIDTTLNCKVSVFGADSITVTGALSFIKTHQNTFCDSATMQFFDSSVVKFDTVATHTWTFGDGATSNATNPFHNFITPGLYPVRLVVQTTSGCTDSSANTFVKVVKSPSIQIAGPSATCVGQPVTFSGSAQDTSLLQWSWNFNNGNNYSTASPPPQTFIAAGNQTITASVTNSSGCVKSASEVLTVNPLPNVSAGADSIICRGVTLTLNPSGADTYLWNPNSSLSCTSCANPVASPVDTSVYYIVTGTNTATACKNVDSVKVKVIQPFKIMGMISDTLCAGQSVNLGVTGADNYTWTPATGLSNPHIANPVAKPDTTTLYTVVGHDFRNCFSDVGYVPITVYPIPVFNIIDQNISIAIGNSVTLATTSSADVINWEWFPTTGLSCSTCAQPVASPKNTTVYKAFATNKGGCKAEDRITVQVFCNNGNLFMPNTFSPNNDGSNDKFYPRGKGIAGVKSLQIFDRWGTLVFKRSNFSINDANAGWDGTYNGRRLDADVFVYQVEVICETGEVFSFKGDVSLIR